MNPQDPPQDPNSTFHQALSRLLTRSTERLQQAEASARRHTIPLEQLKQLAIARSTQEVEGTRVTCQKCSGGNRKRHGKVVYQEEAQREVFGVSETNFTYLEPTSGITQAPHFIFVRTKKRPTPKCKLCTDSAHRNCKWPTRDDTDITQVIGSWK